MKFIVVLLLGTLWATAKARSNSGFVSSGAPSLSTARGPDFGVLWHTNPHIEGEDDEEFMSTPVVYNNDNNVLVGSSLNKVYALNAQTGAVIASRKLRDSSFACGDMKVGVGILGSPVLQGDTAFVYAKSEDGYYLHSFNTKTLRERRGFPVHVDGPATTDSSVFLNSTMLLQRPALNLVGGIVYGAIGGGCGGHSTIVSGWVVGVNATNGAIVSRWPSGGGIWQTGHPLSSDRPDRLFVAIANGDDSSVLEGAVARLDISGSGRVGSPDSFRPWNYTEMDESQRDIGSAAVGLTEFVLRGKKTAVVGGKNGMVHVLDRESLGGYHPEAAGNNVLQEWGIPARPDGLSRGRIFGGVASWPQRGGTSGWLYLRPVDLKTVLVYSFDSRTGFKQIVQTEEPDTTAMGSGAPFVSVDSRGEGILWAVDLKKGLLAWKATPQAGKLVSIPIPKVKAEGSESWTWKFQRPVFGGGRVYALAREGGVVAYGNTRTGNEWPGWHN